LCIQTAWLDWRRPDQEMSSPESLPALPVEVRRQRRLRPGVYSSMGAREVRLLSRQADWDSSPASWWMNCHGYWRQPIQAKRRKINATFSWPELKRMSSN
jgi:hypothetical protein